MKPINIKHGYLNKYKQKFKRPLNDGVYLVSDLTSVLPIVCVFVKAVTGYL